MQNIDASSLQGEFEPKVFTLLNVIQHVFSVVQGQELVRLCWQGLENCPLIVHKLCCIWGQISLGSKDLIAWHNAIVAEHVLNQSMYWSIRIWLIKLEKVADDVDLDFAIVEVLIEFFYACTCELTFNLILFIAPAELEDNKALRLSS